MMIFEISTVVLEQWQKKGFSLKNYCDLHVAIILWRKPLFCTYCIGVP